MHCSLTLSVYLGIAVVQSNMARRWIISALHRGGLHKTPNNRPDLINSIVSRTIYTSNDYFKVVVTCQPSYQNLWGDYAAPRVAPITSKVAAIFIDVNQSLFSHAPQQVENASMQPTSCEIRREYLCRRVLLYRSPSRYTSSKYRIVRRGTFLLTACLRLQMPAQRKPCCLWNMARSWLAKAFFLLWHSRWFGGSMHALKVHELANNCALKGSRAPVYTIWIWRHTGFWH